MTAEALASVALGVQVDLRLDPANADRVPFAVPLEPNTVAEARAVAEVVRQQVDCGLDVVDDGEMGKPSFVTYVAERLAGQGARVFITSVNAIAAERLPFAASGHPITDALALIVSFYGFVEALSRRRGYDPDREGQPGVRPEHDPFGLEHGRHEPVVHDRPQRCQGPRVVQAQAGCCRDHRHCAVGCNVLASERTHPLRGDGAVVIPMVERLDEVGDHDLVELPRKQGINVRDARVDRCLKILADAHLPLHHLFDQGGDLPARLFALLLIPADAPLADDLIQQTDLRFCLGNLLGLYLFLRFSH